MEKKKDTISAKELDRKFDAGEDISEYLDWSEARRPGLEQKTVNFELPNWMIKTIKSEAKRIGG